MIIRAMGRIRLRPMLMSDMAAVLTLDRQTYPFPWPASFFRHLLRGDAACWVYEENGRVIGYGIMRCVGRWAHIMNLCVAPGHRCRGLGERMLRHLLGVARSHAVRHAWLEVRPYNHKAIALYRSLGFRIASRRKGYYRYAPQRQRDALIMYRELDDA